MTYAEPIDSSESEDTPPPKKHKSKRHSQPTAEEQEQAYQKHLAYIFHTPTFEFDGPPPLWATLDAEEDDPDCEMSRLEFRDLVTVVEPSKDRQWRPP